MCLHPLEALVSADVLIQPVCRDYASLLRSAYNVSATRLFREVYRHQFRRQHMYSGDTQQTSVQYESFQEYCDKGKSTMGWYVGFKLHLLCNEKGEIINFVLTRANVDDRDISVIDSLTDKVFGKLYADKGYISQSLFGHLWDKGVHVVTGLRSNMKQRLIPLYDKIMLRKRSIIETLNDMLKNVAQLVHSRHRSVHNFIMNMLAAIGAYCFFSTKPEVNFDYEVPESNGQLVLWQ